MLAAKKKGVQSPDFHCKRCDPLSVVGWFQPSKCWRKSLSVDEECGSFMEYKEAPYQLLTGISSLILALILRCILACSALMLASQQFFASIRLSQVGFILKLRPIHFYHN